MWLQKQAATYQPIEIRDLTDSISLIALQGPLSLSVLEDTFNSKFDYLKRFSFDDFLWDGIRITISRTGYTGEDGFEIFVDAIHAAKLWNLLLDKNKKDLRRWLRRLHDEMHTTSVFVTHDLYEAMEVADRVVVMNEGRIEQVGTPEEVYGRPASSFVYHFLGNVNLFHGRVHEGTARVGDFAVDVPEHAAAQDVPAVGYARPHEIDVDRTPQAASDLTAVLLRVNAAGSLVKLELEDAAGRPLQVEMSRERYAALDPRPGETLAVRPRVLRFFDGAGAA